MTRKVTAMAKGMNNIYETVNDRYQKRTSGILTSVRTIIQSLDYTSKLVLFTQGSVEAEKVLRDSRLPIRVSGIKIYVLKRTCGFEDTYSVPMPLILKREYILIETTMIAMEASVQTIANNEPHLFWSPPLGTGSEAIEW